MVARLIFFLLALGIIAWGVVWLVRYFFGADIRYKKEKLSRKLDDKEEDVDDKLKEMYY